MSVVIHLYTAVINIQVELKACLSIFFLFLKLNHERLVKNGSCVCFFFWLPTTGCPLFTGRAHCHQTSRQLSTYKYLKNEDAQRPKGPRGIQFWDKQLHILWTRRLYSIHKVWRKLLFINRQDMLLCRIQMRWKVHWACIHTYIQQINLHRSDLLSEKLLLLLKVLHMMEVSQFVPLFQKFDAAPS